MRSSSSAYWMSPEPAGLWQTGPWLRRSVRPAVMAEHVTYVTEARGLKHSLSVCFSEGVSAALRASRLRLHIYSWNSVWKNKLRQRGAPSPAPLQHTSSVPSAAPPAAGSPAKHSLCKSAAATGAPLTLLLPSTDTFTRTNAAPVIVNVSSSRSYRGQQIPAVQLS